MLLWIGDSFLPARHGGFQRVHLTDGSVSPEGPKSISFWANFTTAWAEDAASCLKDPAASNGGAGWACWKCDGWCEGQEIG